MRRSLIHNYYQMSLFMVLQHLPQKMNDLFRGNPFIIQVKQKPALTIDGRHRRHATSFACYLLARCSATWSPGLTQEGCQRYVCLILKIQQSPKITDRLANFGGVGTQPLLTSLFVQFKVLPFRFLAGQPGVTQSSPNTDFRQVEGKFFPKYLPHTADCPKIGFKPKIGSRQQNYLPQIPFF